MTAATLREQIERDEGRVAHAYQDSLGFWTIGVGHLIDKRRGGGLPDDLIDALLDHDISTKSQELVRALPWVEQLDPPRFATLVNMAFQLGVPGLLQFQQALTFLKNGEYTAASLAFANSKVAREQSPERWIRHAQQIRTGQWV